MLFLTNHSFSLFTFFPFSLLMWPANSALLCKSEKVWCGTQGVLGSHHVGNSSSSSPRVLQGPTLQPVAARPFKMMVLLFRRRACSLSPVHVQILCDSFLSDKSTCSRTRRKPSFPNVPEITANINRRDVDDSQRRVLTTRRDLANETFHRRQILFDRKAGALAFGHRICLLNLRKFKQQKCHRRYARVVRLHMLCPVSGQSNYEQKIQ